jgi:exonuclease III
MKSMLEDMDYPDMICIQEARLKALDEDQRGEPKPSEYAEVKSVVESVFRDYNKPLWSLADARYAGTVTFLHKRVALMERVVRDGGPYSQQCAFSMDAAIDLILQQFQLTRTQTGLSSSSTMPASPSKKGATTKQLSMKAFFAPKKTTPPSAASSIASPSSGGSRGCAAVISSSGKRPHHPEGRFQFFTFPAMDVLQTYVPNNGTKEESFQRRREWDESMLAFLKDRRTILAHANVPDRPLLWCGDFNCARDYRDGTHWTQREDGSIYEFWTDPVKCQVGKKGGEPHDPGNVGIPSFTPHERKRFAHLLKEGDFVDVWRDLYPDGTPTAGVERWDRPDYTWRGHLARNGNPFAAKFQGKGQRLDYFLLSPSKMRSRVSSCQILGSGEQREGHFCGSDHCATILRLGSG